MLDALETDEWGDEFVDWFEIAREDGRDVDIGYERHWIDPRSAGRAKCSRRRMAR